MTCICSDTNIWIDFEAIGKLDIPFRLPETFIMHDEAVRDELVFPEGLDRRLLAYGLVAVDITLEELDFAQKVVARCRRLSRCDAIALSIAKHRGIALATGDRRLREESERQGVRCMGTIGILDRLAKLDLLSSEEQRQCWRLLYDANGGVVRLPRNELDVRIAALRG